MPDYNANEFDNFTPPSDNSICPVVGHQSLAVCLPVEITPYAKVGATTTTCKGEPIIKPGCTTCTGTKNGTCAFTISQVICVEVPVFFGASTYVGDTFVDCLCAPKEEICDCDHDCR